jgi:hypothetical protein
MLIYYCVLAGVRAAAVVTHQLSDEEGNRALAEAEKAASL